METIDFEQLDYGLYQLDSDGIMLENIRYATSDFNRLYTRKVRLPEGNGNLVFLLSNTFSSTLSMIENGVFVMPPTYRKIYYPVLMTGSFLGRRYRKYISGGTKTEHDQLVRSKTKLRVYPGRVLRKSKDNIIVNLGDVYEAVKPILTTKPLKQVYNNFWKEFAAICNRMTYDVDEKSHKVLIIDCDTFGWTGNSLEDAKSNPLYLLYIAYLRNRDLSKLNVDMDMMICSKNLFMKFNPAKLDMKMWGIFRRGLFRIMKSDLDAFTDSLSEEEKKELQDTAQDKVLSSIVANTVDAYTKNSSSAVKSVIQDKVEEKLRKTAAEKVKIDKEIKKAVPQKKLDSFDSFMNGRVTTANPVKNPFTPAQQKLFQRVAGDYEKLASDTGIEVDDDYDDDEYTYSDEEEEILQDDAQDILMSDDEVKDALLTELQNRVEPKPDSKSPQANSARDAKLREAQKKVVVKNSTIEQLLEQETDNVPIQEEDKSKVMHTANKNMQHIKFANFEKTYLDSLYYKDIIACFDMLKDQESPFFITDVKITDTSTALDLKETWTVSLKDEFGKKHTMKVDIPRFKDNKFMLINGTKYIMLKQNFYKPLVKDTPDTVILTTNFNKVTITRKATRSLNMVERLFSLIKKANNPKMFLTGDSSQSNRKYISSLEYDEISKHLFKIEMKSCELCFSRKWIEENWDDKIPSDIKKDEFYIGTANGSPVIINEDTGLDRSGRTIVQIIEENLPDDLKTQFNSIKGPNQSMYVECKMASEFIPVITALIVWNGLKKTLDLMGTEWSFSIKRPPAGSKYIRFSDGYLIYKPEIFSELLLNGLQKMHPEQYTFEDFESEAGYEEFMYAQWGSFNGITEIKSFNNFLVDPITKSVCRDINLPDTPSGLLIHAVKMLCDNAFNSKASDKSYRVRSLEIIPAILYSAIAIQYKNYIKSGRRIPFTLNQRCVMSMLKSGPVGTEAYSTLNPVVEVNKSSTISAKGYRGTNKDRSYDEAKRSYDPSSVGKLAISTSADAGVGVTKQLATEPDIQNARGFRSPLPDEDQKEERAAALAELKDVNVFSPTEMITPGTAKRDDPIRTAIDL